MSDTAYPDDERLVDDFEEPDPGLLPDSERTLPPDSGREEGEDEEDEEDENFDLP